jgi:hypothetical protein
VTARLFALGLLALALGCGGAAGRSAPLRVDRQLSGGATTLVLVAAPGVRINARVKPSLELPDGTVLRFDSPHLTADSAYSPDLRPRYSPGASAPLRAR